jgi:hypothetical protein
MIEASEPSTEEVVGAFPWGARPTGVVMVAPPTTLRNALMVKAA